MQAFFVAFQSLTIAAHQDISLSALVECDVAFMLRQRISTRNWERLSAE